MAYVFIVLYCKKITPLAQDDFTFTNAVINFQNMDQIVDYINNNSVVFNAQAQYATVGDYFEELYKANLSNWRIFDKDFFPYPTNQTFWYILGFFHVCS